jgi:hypothetical protein
MTKKLRKLSKSERAEKAKADENIILYNSRFVVATAEKMLDLMKAEVAKEPIKVRWLLYARIVNLVFHSFFKPALEWSDRSADAARTLEHRELVK